MRSFASLLLVSTSVLVLTACGGGGGGGSNAQPPVASLTVQPSTLQLGIGQAAQLVATPEDSMGNVLAGRAVTWASSNTSVATVNSSGLLVAVALGEATITASSEGQSAMATLTVVTGLVLAGVSAGGRHTCGVSNTAVSNAVYTYCWGDNSSGQLGNGTTTNSSTPVAVAGGLTLGFVSAGAKHTCGLAVGGAAYCWGENSSGQLGNGTNTNSSVPVAVVGGLQFVTLSAGTANTCGIGLAGIVYCWGDNSFGQLGNGKTTNSAVPVAVSGQSTQLSAGGNHTCSNFVPSPLQLIGRMYCWGDNTFGQLGNGTTTNSSLPVAPLVGNNVRFISVGMNYTCAVNFSGDTFCWGDNSSGQFGNGTTTSSATPVAIAGGPGFVSFSAGALHMCALGVNFPHAAYCWGDNSFGQLGDGTTANRSQSVAVVGGSNVYSLSAGGGHSCMVLINPPELNGGIAYCWGDNSSGQLGNGTTTNSPLPVVVAHAP